MPIKSKKISKISFFQPGRMNLFKPVKLNTRRSVRKLSMKNLTWPQASVRFPRLNPFGDSDKDGKLNMFDCHPFDRKRHSEVSFRKEKINVSTPDDIRPMVNILNKKGKAYVVGGFVRDTLLRRPPKDVDLEVHGMSPDEISNELKSAGYRVDEVGKSFGVLKVTQPGSNRKEAIDVSVPREDSTGRKPTVTLSKNMGPKKAASRRDFTINSMMYDTKNDKVVDPYRGLKDLEQGRIKAVSKRAFSDDPLRVVRAAQFASRFDFDIEPNTIAEARKAKMSGLSGERIQEELKKVSEKAQKPSKFFNAMDEMGQLDTVFPEVAKLKGVKQDPIYHPEGDAYVHTMDVIDRIGKAKNKNYKMFLSGVLHDVGKAETEQTVSNTGKITSIGHEEKSVEIGRKFLNRLHVSDDDKNDVLNTVEFHMEPHHLVNTNTTNFKHKNRLLVKVAGGYGKLANNPEKAIERYNAAIEFAKMDKNPEHDVMEKYNELEKIPSPSKYKRVAKGEDVIAEGYSGAEVGKRLDELYTNQIAHIKEDVPVREDIDMTAQELIDDTKDLNNPNDDK